MGWGVTYQAERKRICDTAILPKMKKEERPDKARSQLKMLPPPVRSKLRKARQPKRSWRRTTVNGRPFLSTYEKIFGPMPVP